MSETKFQNLYNNIDDCEFTVEIISNKEEKVYVNKYLCIIKNNNKYKNTKLILYTDKKEVFDYGDILIIKGNFEYAKEARNYKGYNYRRTLWQNKIFGILKSENITIISHRNSFNGYLNKLKNKIEDNIDKCIENDEYRSFLKGIIIGDKSNLSEEIKSEFKDASLSHLLAISGMHIGYIVLFVKRLFVCVKNKKLKDFLEILIVFFYIKLINNSPSSIRAGIMFGMIIISENIYRKSITIINWFTALIIILIINPFYIENTGLWLSFLGTLGIIIIYQKLDIKKENKILNYIYQNFFISVCVQICIFPIIIYNYNTISFTFFISNIIISFLIGPVLFLGFLISVLGSNHFICTTIGLIENVLITVIFYITNFISKIKISKIYVKTPNIIYIVFYYIFFIGFFYKKIFLKYLRILIILLIIITIILSFSNLRSRLTIYFIDVGQGDCTLIKTAKNKTILIDGGEGNSAKFDEGKNTVLPYLLDRGIDKLDYIIISHFDSDHCGGIFFIMENIKVKNIIIGKQFENSDNYKEFLKIIKEKNIKLQIVHAGKKLNIEKNLYFEILWPDIENNINENILNNNSLVCKLVYNNFSCIFTGDVEEIAEKAILDKYKNNLNILKSDVLKVAHHGSKTSSNNNFLNKIKPKIALIGVGENNNFGHPNIQIIERLKDNGIKVYRTDQDGEISIYVNNKGNIKIKKFIEYSNFPKICIKK